ncbi:putative Glycosyltransferase like family 2 Glycosyl transferase family 2 [Trypanosoma vivax]|nr:dolichyl-phosphate beta-D-mannosyltransferase precursor [Trypanosoma vivax]KAH8611316.1 putative Glycosyltransferase like family 2 Glycosyl transferase family 2 [Trypanosoma vivax]
MSVKYSIVVPTYKERDNIGPLTREVFDSLVASGYVKTDIELIIVDDNSQDGSVEVVEKLQREGYAVRIVVRTNERGLSSAVIHGMDKSSGAFILVMDADLQHPPSAVPHLLCALEKPGVEFVCGTRYHPGVRIDRDWPLYRRIVSWGGRMLSRPLTPLSDPMSGFFALRAEVFQRARGALNPIGYKIALEIFVKSNVSKYEEVGFNFSTRLTGESKLTGKVIVHYLQHLQSLYVYCYGRLIKYVILLVLAIFYILDWPISLG